MAVERSSVALAIQEMGYPEQVLVLLEIATARSPTGRAAPAEVSQLFDELGLPRPAKVINVLTTLETRKLVSRTKATGPVWRLSPAGRARRLELIDDFAIAALTAEAKSSGAPMLGSALHPTLPPTMAPPELMKPLAAFLDEHEE